MEGSKPGYVEETSKWLSTSLRESGEHLTMIISSIRIEKRRGVLPKITDYRMIKLETIE